MVAMVTMTFCDVFHSFAQKSQNLFILVAMVITQNLYLNISYIL